MSGTNTSAGGPAAGEKEFITEDKIMSQMTLRQLFMRLWPLIDRQRGRLIFIVLLVLAFSGLGRLLPFLFGYAVDHGIGAKDMSVVKTVALIYFVAEIFRLTCAFSMSYLMEKLGNRVLFDLREKLINHVQRLTVSYFDKNPSGRIVTRVTNDVLSLGDLFNQGFTAIFVSTLEMITIAIAMLYVSPLLSILTLVATPVAVWMSMHTSRKARFHLSETKKKMAQQNAFTAESLNGMKVLQLFNQTGQRQEGFAKLSNEYKQAQLGSVKQFALLWPILAFFNVATIASALLFGALFRDELALTIGQVVSFVLLVQSFYPPIRTLLERYNQFQNSLAGADRLYSLLDAPTEKADGKNFAMGTIEYKNVSFKYGPDSQYAVQNISFSIRKGESVALVGRTGSGKSTLVALLQKLYPYNEGSISINGVELEHISSASLRGRLGVVQQDPFIFNGSFLSNVTLHDERISRPMAEKALTHMGLYERMNQNIESKVEERGGNLSVGEKQILAFARVLAHDPEILILDEATANIDSASEVLIQKATQEVMKGRTSIIIAHRLSTVMNCDRIVVLDKGHIVESGSHSELLAKNGVYAKYYETGLAELTV